jgi:ABC-2 type transport system ATP-binding protein
MHRSTQVVEGPDRRVAGPPAIEVDGLVRTYGEVRAVDGVSFTVAGGEFFGILGPNGAGKTTTLELVEGLREPDAGRIRLLGEPPWPRNPRLLPRIGVQHQASAFFDKLDAREQLEPFGSLYGAPAARVTELLELVGLTEAANTREDRLSGGQRQRLSIACALVHDPDVVFLDEPTGALDPQARRNLWDVLGEIQGRGKTIVYTTHHLDEAEVLCDRVAIMDHGRVSPATAATSWSAPGGRGCCSGRSQSSTAWTGSACAPPPWRTSTCSSPDGSTGHERHRHDRPHPCPRLRAGGGAAAPALEPAGPRSPGPCCSAFSATGWRCCSPSSSR